ncbi:MAG: hypothetical protein NC548_55025, partial [Lachnospiraceae bacterium]|nr:hypothetical protein [Lachnospiraceae bacterium]
YEVCGCFTTSQLSKTGIYHSVLSVASILAIIRFCIFGNGYVNTVIITDLVFIATIPNHGAPMCSNKFFIKNLFQSINYIASFDVKCSRSSFL